MKVIKIVITVLLFTSISLAQQDEINEIKAFVSEQNKEFKDPKKSPLTREDRKEFKKLDYFEIDLSYRVEATFVRTPNELSFAMDTSTDRKPIYVKYGELHFEIKGEKLKLSVYQNESLTFVEEYKDYLFLPFIDKTSGDTSYGGGRYIDMKIPTSDKVTLDFNQSYNPYCAYSGRYSCPKPPSENTLDIAINAGVKSYDKH